MSSSAIFFALPKEVLQHTVSYLNPFDQTALKKTSRIFNQILIKGELETVQKFYENLHQDLSGRKIKCQSFIDLEIPLILVDPHLEEGILKNATISENLFLEILYRLQNKAIHSNPRSNQFYKSLPQEIRKKAPPHKTYS